MNDITNPPAQRAVIEPVSAEVLQSVILNGDLSKLTAQQRVDYMLGVCRTLGLNPATKPFEFLSLQGKLVMYARRDCTEQLRKIHGVSITIKAREVITGVYVVTANAADAKGRVDESTGAVTIDGLKGELLANAMMKAETKAKRRVTLSICGLGMLDESEVDGAQASEHAPRQKVATVTGEVKTKKPEWTKDQSDEAAALRTAITKLGGDEEFRALWAKMKYDAPTDVIDAMGALLTRWQDIDDEAKEREAKEPVVITGADGQVG